MSNVVTSLPNRLPVPFEDIQVCFFLDDVETWFLATVERMHLLSTINIPIVGNVPLATGTVLYHSAYGFEQVREDVEFLLGDKICTTDETTHQKVPTPWRHVEGLTEQDGDYKMEPKPASNQEQCTQSLDMNVQSDTEQKDVVQDIMRLQRRLFAVENELSSHRVCDHGQVINERVQALKALSGVEVLARIRHTFKGSCTSIKSEESMGAHSALTRSTMTIKIPCDYKLFKYLCRTIDVHGSTTYMRPPLRNVLKNDYRAVHVILNGLHGLCTTLGICCTEMEKYLVYDTDNNTVPLRLFIASSCSKEPPVQTGHDEANVVQFENAIWDAENNTMESLPVLASRTRGMSVDTQSLHAFMLVWETDHRPSGTIDVRVGHLKILVPYCTVRNSSIVHELKQIITSPFLKCSMGDMSSDIGGQSHMG